LSLNNDPVITQTPYNTFSSSIQSRVTTLEIASASLSTRVTNLESTASVLTTASASFAIVSSSFATTSGSLSTRTTNLESTASVLTTASASFAIVSASYAALSGSFRSGSYTGSFTGTLIGTASWATNAVTASNATTASFVLNAISASFASTASSVNTLVQPVIISGSFTVFTGSAVEFQVTNTGVKIGNVGSDFHTITGSIYQSGSSVAASLRGSGSAVFSVDGTVGRLFQIDDSLSGSLFSVNTAAGLPIIEAFSDNTVRIAQFGQRAFFVSQSVVGIGKESALNGKLDISGSTFITGSLNVSQGITGSLFGTSSWALNAVTSSFVLNAVSASFAATASSVNPLVQNVLITGSLFVSSSNQTQLRVGSNLLFVSSSGQVGIGTTNPISRLQIGTLASTSTATPETLNLGGTFSSTAGSNVKLRVYDDGSAIGGMSVSSGQMEVNLNCIRINLINRLCSSNRFT